ncbi:hypothetical protein NT6N_38460 [Oceaniferula spumae]|uniref:Ice-binding protein C-terminal domain-containing protein n=1 Tax=Oceaniferula spumae TaxID=2979115 RepID=A0AAT9FSE3_9BACT
MKDNIFSMKKIVVVASVAMTFSSQAATISWGSAYNIENDVTNIPSTFDSFKNGGVSTSGVVSTLTAVNQGGGLSTPTVNGITFTSQGTSADYWGYPGMDSGIDTVLSTHSAFTGGIGTANLTLNGLTIGRLYQVQLLVAHDTRGCCADRQYEIGFGDNDFTSGGTPQILTRSNSQNDTNLTTNNGFGTIVGTFVADDLTQVISFRSNTQDGNNADDQDPALSGYVVLQSVPEPSSTALLGLGGLALILRRRK